MLLSKQDINFFIDTGKFDNIIAEITNKNISNSSLEYCNGYNGAIDHFILVFKKQYTPEIKCKITNLMERMRKGEVRYFTTEKSPYKCSKVDNSLLSDAMCDVLCLVYFDMLAFNKTEYREGFHKAVIDIATYCGLRELK